jgi:hypothetical protein
MTQRTGELTCQSVFPFYLDSTVLSMSLKMPFSPRIYWLICTFIFFFLTACSLTKSLLRKGASESQDTTILYSKYPKKLSPKFYAEGSSYYRFIERTTLGDEAKAIDWELTFLVFDQDYLASVKEYYPKADTNLYKLSWRKKTGTYILAENKKDFTANFTLLESGEVSSNLLPDLLQALASQKGKTLRITESESFYVEGEAAYLTRETITSDSLVDYEWKNELPSDSNAPRSTFNAKNQANKPSKFSSSHYDFFQFQFEVIETLPNRLFYKSLFADAKTEIYFLPPLANAASTKPSTPIGFKRVGNYLLREESL